MDLGCFPGSWLVYAAQIVGDSGRVVGIDLKPVTIPIPPQAVTYAADLSTLSQDWWSSLGMRFHVVISDMMQATTGKKTVDAARSFYLCQTALAVADQVLRTDGSFVCKFFQGSDFNPFLALVKERFHRFKIFKPQSSRKASSEIYIIGLKKK